MAVAPGGVALAYDPLDRLFNINSEGSVDPTLTYDGADVIAEVDQNNGALLRRYVQGPGSDEPLIWYEGAGTSDRRWLHADERGSVVAVTNDAGTAIAINSYDEYGIPGSSNIGRFQYTGQKWLPSVGMYDYKNRMYSPSLGRFMQTDPIGYGDGLNWYNYVGGDPVNFSDPNGLDHSSSRLPCASNETFVGIDHDGRPICNPYVEGPDIVATGTRELPVVITGALYFLPTPQGPSAAGSGSGMPAVPQMQQVAYRPNICQMRDWHNLKLAEKVGALRAAGYTVALNVRIARFPSTSSNYAVADYIALAPGSTPSNRTWYLGEVKTGNAQLTFNQNANYYSGLTEILSNNAANIFLDKGDVIPVIWNGVDRFPGCPSN